MSGTPSLLERLRERKLVQWALTYLAGAWLILQVTDILGDQFAWPSTLLRSITVLLGIGFFAALILAWFHGEKGHQRVSGIELLVLAVLLVIAGTAVAFVADKPDNASPEERLSASVPPAEQGSVAVLPFVDMSAERNQEYFSDGITEELLNALTKVPGLRVAARTSSFQFKGRNPDVREVGEKLAVAHVLEGSIRKAGDRLRITAQLIDARNGYHLWSETYDRDLKDIFAVQEEISKAIVEALQIQLAAGNANVVRGRTDDLDAYDLYLRGRYLWNQRSGESLREAARLFEQALERDATFALAWSGLADAYYLLGWFQVLPTAEAFPRAKAAAERAIALDPTLAEAHTSLAMLRIFTASDWKGAERAFRRAIELNPDYPVARQWYAWHLAWTGRGDAAIPQMKRAMQLDPLSGPMRAQYLYILHLAGRDSAITAEVERRLTEAPDNPILFVHLGLAKLRQGHHTEAIAALRQAGERPGRRPDDYWFIQVPLAYAYAVAGQRQQAMEIANQPESRTEVASTALVDLAGVYTALGEKDKALQILEGYHRAGNIHRLVWLGSDPALAPLRSEPRYKRLLQQVRLE